MDRPLSPFCHFIKEPGLSGQRPDLHTRALIISPLWDVSPVPSLLPARPPTQPSGWSTGLWDRLKELWAGATLHRLTGTDWTSHPPPPPPPSPDRAPVQTAGQVSAPYIHARCWSFVIFIAFYCVLISNNYSDLIVSPPCTYWIIYSSSIFSGVYFEFFISKDCLSTMQACKKNL